MKAKIWFGCAVSGTLFILAVFAGSIILFDPFFHYHEPVEGVAYILDESRYQNDGIVKHFSYDTLITGTSMVSNFRTSECDALFGGVSVKTPFHGASFLEIDSHVKTAIAANEDLRTVIRCLDQLNFAQDKDYMNYDDIPYYLYDDNPLNDVNYVLNKEVLMRLGDAMADTAEGRQMTSFDEYMNWQNEHAFGKEAVLTGFTRPAKSSGEGGLSEQEREQVLANIRQNVTDTARENPDVTFYYFFSPYSVCFWDIYVMRLGRLDWYMDLQRLVIGEILTCDNIRLFAYDDRTEITSDLNNYRDHLHYSEEINSLILRWMKEDEGRLTKENYEAYLERLYVYYGAYDYDSIYN